MKAMHEKVELAGTLHFLLHSTGSEIEEAPPTH